MEPSRDVSSRMGNQRLNLGLRRVRYAQQEFPVQQILAQSRHLRQDVMRTSGDRHVRTPTPMPPPNHPLALNAAARGLAGAPALPTLNQEEIQAYYMRSLVEKADNKSSYDDDLLLFDESGSEDGDNASKACSASLPARAHEGPKVSNTKFGRLVEVASSRVASPMTSTSINALDEHASKQSVSIGLGNRSLAYYMDCQPHARKSSSMDLRDTAMTPKVNYDDFCTSTDRLSPSSKISNITEDDLEIISIGPGSTGPKSVTDEDLGTSSASLARYDSPTSSNGSEEDLDVSSPGRSVIRKGPSVMDGDLGGSMTSLGFSIRPGTRSISDKDLDLEVISLCRNTSGSKTSNKIQTESSQVPQPMDSQGNAVLETSTSSTSDNMVKHTPDVAKATESNPPIGQSSYAWTADAPSVLSGLKKRISRVFARITRPFRACLRPATKE